MEINNGKYTITKIIGIVPMSYNRFLYTVQHRGGRHLRYSWRGHLQGSAGLEHSLREIAAAYMPEQLTFSRQSPPHFFAS
jgi:hypothetical protein